MLNKYSIVYYRYIKTPLSIPTIRVTLLLRSLQTGLYLYKHLFWQNIWQYSLELKSRQIETILLLAIYLLLSVFGFVYIRSGKPNKKNLFEELGVPFKPPRLIFGSYGRLMLRQENFYDMVLNWYDEFKGSR